MVRLEHVSSYPTQRAQKMNDLDRFPLAPLPSIPHRLHVPFDFIAALKTSIAVIRLGSSRYPKPEDFVKIRKHDGYLVFKDNNSGNHEWSSRLNSFVEYHLKIPISV